MARTIAQHMLFKLLYIYQLSSTKQQHKITKPFMVWEQKPWWQIIQVPI